MKLVHAKWVIFVGLLLATGCSTSSPPLEPISPSSEPTGAGLSSGVRTWGVFEVTIDPETHEAEVVPLRSASVEVNVLRFLEDPGSFPKILISDLSFNPPEVTCTVGIYHPFPEFPEYTGEGSGNRNQDRGKFHANQDNLHSCIHSPCWGLRML